MNFHVPTTLIAPMVMWVLFNYWRKGWRWAHRLILGSAAVYIVAGLFHPWHTLEYVDLAGAVQTNEIRPAEHYLGGIILSIGALSVLFGLVFRPGISGRKRHLWQAGFAVLGIGAIAFLAFVDAPTLAAAYFANPSAWPSLKVHVVGVESIALTLIGFVSLLLSALFKMRSTTMPAQMVFKAARVADFLDSEPPRPIEKAPDSIGKYDLVEVLGSGGMGTVYKAVQ